MKRKKGEEKNDYFCIKYVQHKTKIIIFEILRTKCLILFHLFGEFKSNVNVLPPKIMLKIIKEK